MPSTLTRKQWETGIKAVLALLCDWKALDWPVPDHDMKNLVDAAQKAIGSTKQLVPGLPAMLETPAFREAWGQWVQYRAERRAPLTKSTSEKQLAKLARVGPVTGKAMIDQSIEQGWQGLFEVKDGTHDTRPLAGGFETPKPVS